MTPLPIRPCPMDSATAREHLGGQRALAMIGGTLSRSVDHVVVKFKAKARDGIKAFAVYLGPDDLYCVRFIAMRIHPTVEVRVVEDIAGIDCDNLKTTIETRLGLRLSL